MFPDELHWGLVSDPRNMFTQKNVEGNRAYMLPNCRSYDNTQWSYQTFDSIYQESNFFESRKILMLTCTLFNEQSMEWNLWNNIKWPVYWEIFCRIESPIYCSLRVSMDASNKKFPPCEIKLLYAFLQNWRFEKLKYTRIPNRRYWNKLLEK